MVPHITAYDISLEIRYSGESTTAEGWIEIDGARRSILVEASASDRGATYTIDGDRFFWNEVPDVDEWFEDRWVEAATDAGYDLENEIDFDARVRSGERQDTPPSAAPEQVDAGVFAYQLVEHISDSEGEDRSEAYLAEVIEEVYLLVPGVRRRLRDALLTDMVEELNRRGACEATRAVEEVRDDWRRS